MPNRFRSALIALIVTGLAACATVQPVPYGPIERIDSDIGKSLNQMFVRMGEVTAYERTYDASEATGEFRAPIRRRYPPNDPQSAFVTIREVWWNRAGTYHSYFFVRGDKYWEVIEAFKWQGHSRIDTQERVFPL